MPVHKSDFQFIGLQNSENDMIVLKMLFQIWYKINILDWLLKKQVNSFVTVHYLDYFLVVGREGYNNYAKLVSIFSSIYPELEVFLAQEKLLVLQRIPSFLVQYGIS